MFHTQASTNYAPQGFSPFHPRPIPASATPDAVQANMNAQPNAYHTFSPGNEVRQAYKRRVEEDLQLKIQAIKDAYTRDNAMIQPPSPEPCACRLGPSCTHQAEVLVHQKNEFMRIDEEYRQATTMIINEALETCAQMLQMEWYRREVAYSQREQSVSDATTAYSPAKSDSGRRGYIYHQHPVHADEENVTDSPVSSNGSGGSAYQNHYYEPFHQLQTRCRRSSIIVDQNITNSPESTNCGGGSRYQDASPRQPQVQISPPSSSTSRRQHQYGDSIIPLPGMGPGNSTPLPKRIFSNPISRASEAATPPRSTARPRLSIPTVYRESQYAWSLLSPPPVRLNMPVSMTCASASSASAAPPAATIPHRHHWRSASMTTATSAAPSMIPPPKPARVVPRTSQSDGEPDDEWKDNPFQEIRRKAEKMEKQKRASHATFMKGIPNEDDRKVFDWEYEQSKSRPQPKMDIAAWVQYQFRTEVARERERLVQKHNRSQREREATSEARYKR